MKNEDIHYHNTRQHSNLHLPQAKTNKGKQPLTCQATADFNNLGQELLTSQLIAVSDYALHSVPSEDVMQ
mgnify:CR=1 FL=1